MAQAFLRPAQLVTASSPSYHIAFPVTRAFRAAHQGRCPGATAAQQPSSSCAARGRSAFAVRASRTDRQQSAASSPRSRSVSPRRTPEAAAGSNVSTRKRLDPYSMDLDMWHYPPFSFWWFSPPAILVYGVSFVVAANLLDEGGPCIKTTLLALAPVVLLWLILLRELPSQFKKFAVDYIQTHDFTVSSRSSASKTTSGRTPRS